MTKYAINSIHEVPDGKLKVLEILPKKVGVVGRSNTRAVVRFIISGYTANVQLSNIPQGKVKDKRKPSVYGVGYIDTDITIPQRKSGSLIRQTYDLWCNMLKRCYGAYGRDETIYADVTVDKRWHSFKQFLNTVHLIPGYSKWIVDPKLHLDKDKSGSREYSLNTCVFITGSENSQIANKKRWAKK